MSVDGAGWLERSERQREEDPERAVRLLRIQPGSSVADIGAGSGYFTIRLARLVGRGRPDRLDAADALRPGGQSIRSPQRALR